MKRILLMLYILVALGVANAQERRPFSAYPFEHYTVDLFDNVYVWSGPSLVQYDRDGKQVRNYSNPSLGTITHVDASYPSKILVFYQEAACIVLLDNQLSPIGNTLDLLAHNLFTISLASMIGTSKIALYDQQNQTLILSDIQLNITGTTHCQMENDFHPTSMQSSQEKTIMLTDTTKGVYLFDILGSFQQKIMLPNAICAQMVGDELVYLQNGSLRFYHLQQHTYHDSDLPASAYRSFHLGSQCLYIQDTAGYVYQIPRLLKP
ncbi:MAG: hypothetical protein IJK85_03915 [Bacteroidales bacterium]|nr:hypothetical protein [Bacteroidales bacterium]